MNHNQLKEKLLSNSETLTAYQELIPEFSVLHEMLKARQSAGLSQAEVAERMGTHAPAVTRLESSLANGKHSPSLMTLQKYAKAVGCKLQIKFVHA